MKKITMALVALAAVAALELPAASGAAGASRADQAWLAGALQTDLFELQAGETATMEGQSKGAVHLGETLSKAHASLFADGKKLAAKIGVRPPAEPSRRQVGLLQKLEVLNGKEFDQVYAEEMVEGHLESIAKAKAEIARGSNAMVKAAAKTDLKMYEMHLRMARALKAELGGR